MSAGSDAPRRTDPRGFLVKGISGLGQAALPIAAGLYGSGMIAAGILAVAPIVLALMAASFGLSWLAWHRLTYTTGTEDIRVEQGILSRSARSVPYERIQDVSIEQKFLPRLFGLAQVKFETGAGGGEEIALTYLSLEEAERLRQLVRERREEAVEAAGESPASMQAGPEKAAHVLFAMDEKRIFTFGLFEFSLVIFAVLLGAAQQFDFLLPFDIWEWENWAGIFDGQRDWIEHSSRAAQAAALLGGLLGVVALGSITGLARTFAREYGFVLERTDRGFRRRRGLFNRSDVTLPAHRVQAALVGTRFVRRRFGWHSLKFVSLARDDAGSSSHVVAPFAKLEEIWPLVREAGIAPPPQELDWRRPMADPWIAEAVVGIAIALTAGIGISIARGSPMPLGIALILIGLMVLGSYVSWRHHRHARDGLQVYARKGSLAPRLAIAPQVKLQTVEIVQGPIARWRGYATLNFGLAGGTLEIPGLPVEEARRLRREIVARIAEVDFSELPR